MSSYVSKLGLQLNPSFSLELYISLRTIRRRRGRGGGGGGGGGRRGEGEEGEEGG